MTDYDSQIARRASLGRQELFAEVDRRFRELPLAQRLIMKPEERKRIAMELVLKVLEERYREEERVEHETP